MPPHRGIAFVLIDGLGDVSIPELGNRTPLEAAHTPFLDALAGQNAAAAEFRERPHWFLAQASPGIQALLLCC